ncbi:MAG TPA: inositol-3-phosphate synthase, partial [Vicinamibacterales bacterium]
RTEANSPSIKDFVPLASLDDVVFGGWDLFDENCYEAAKTAGVLEKDLLDQIRPELEQIRPWPAVFDRRYVKRLDGPNVKKGRNKRDLADQVRADIQKFKSDNGLSRLVMVWCGSTEVYLTESPAHATIEAFEKGLEASDDTIPSSMIYAYAAIKEGIPYANAAPNLSADIPALIQLAQQTGSPMCGKDLKTGQTLIKTIIAPGLKARLIGVEGWYSTNILGNRDGEVLDDPESFKTKEESKKSVLDYIMQPALYPELYANLCHVVRINYYPPRGDNKEGWDNIDIFGWLGYKMQLKINFLCRDSILAAPIVLDSALFLDLAKRAGMRGIQEWLSFYYKSPMHAAGLYPEHDLFIQLMKLKNTLRYMQGEELITHLGREYYD